MPTAAATTITSVTGILLAAGRGTRFGSDKTLHPLPDGTPMAVASARLLLSACPQSVAVLRPEQIELAHLLQALGLRVLLDAQAAQGMGHSLAAAVRATPSASGWLVALADMPFIQPATVAAVAQTIQQGARIAAPFIGSRRGHPVGFSRVWFNELAQLQGDQGARALLAAHAQDITRVACDDAGALVDVDEPRLLT